MLFHLVFIYSFHSQHNLDQWYERDFLFVLFLRMSLMRSRYRELGLKLIKPNEDFPHQPNKSPMVDDKKDDRVGNAIKMLFKEPLG